MSTIICQQCQAEIEVPAGYNMPYIKCTVCGAPQRLQINVPTGPKFQILNHKRRANIASQTVVEENIENPVNTSAANNAPDVSDDSAATQPVRPTVKKQVAPKRIEHNASFIPIEEDKMILDSMGEEGMKKAYELVAEYICSTSLKAKAAGRAKALQRLMKEKYPASMATKAIAYAERLPEVMEMGKKKNIKKAIIIAAVAAVGIATTLSFL